MKNYLPILLKLPVNKLRVALFLIIAALGVCFFWVLKTRPFARGLCPGCNVVLISIDTLGARHLDAYGYSRETAPFFTTFAKDNIIFKHAFANSCNTLPSHASIFTGLYPHHHEITAPAVGDFLKNDLDQNILTLPQFLKNAGYFTAASYLDHPFLPKERMFGRGFDKLLPSEMMLMGRSEEMLQSIPRQPFFLFVHTYAVHDPYVTSITASFGAFHKEKGYHGKIIGQYEELKKLFDQVCPNGAGLKGVWNDKFGNCGTMDWSRLYWSRVNLNDSKDIDHLRALHDEMILVADYRLKQFLTGLFAHFDKGKTIVIITSDHGEAFGEHGMWHEKLYDEVLHIPLVMSIPNLVGLTISNEVESVDILPTILDLLQIGTTAKFDGKSLLPLLKENRSLDKNGISNIAAGIAMSQISLRKPPWKFIESQGALELFNMETDSLERKNVSKENPDLVKYFENEIKKIRFK